jgi:hypothetical protein
VEAAAAAASGVNGKAHNRETKRTRNLIAAAFGT